MALPNIFSKEVSDNIIQRINSLQPGTQPAWGKMNAAQMLAHCNVTYEMAYENIHPKPNFCMKFILTSLVKPKVTGETPYKHNSPAAPAFIIKSDKNFGILTITEWNNMFYKHLHHHLTQFGV